MLNTLNVPISGIMSFADAKEHAIGQGEIFFKVEGSRNFKVSINATLRITPSGDQHIDGMATVVYQTR